LLIAYGVIAEGGNLLIGGLSVYMTIKNRTTEILKGTLIAAVFSLCATALLHLTGKINLYTIGLPIIFSQIMAVAYLYRTYIKNK
jgi:O-antigen/teichoic acid export membrane protein